MERMMGYLRTLSTACNYRLDPQLTRESIIRDAGIEGFYELMTLEEWEEFLRREGLEITGYEICALEKALDDTSPTPDMIDAMLKYRHFLTSPDMDVSDFLIYFFCTEDDGELERYLSRKSTSFTAAQLDDVYDSLGEMDRSTRNRFQRVLKNDTRFPRKMQKVVRHDSSSSE